MKNHKRIPQDLNWNAIAPLGLFALGLLVLLVIISSMGCRKEPDCVVWSPVKDTLTRKHQ
jgi:hypothetical protein